jgi:hypothetical protein
MDLREIVPADVHIYKGLADDYKKEDFSREDYVPGRSLLPILGRRIKKLNKRVANPKAKNVQERLGLVVSSSSSEVREHFLGLENCVNIDYLHALLPSGVSIDNLDFETYLDIGKGIIEGLGFKCYKFETEKVLACMNDTEDQGRSFGVDWHGLFVGNLGERAMHQILMDNGVEFTARGYLIHNSRREQPILDISAWSGESVLDSLEDKPLSIGVRSQIDFSGKYLYREDRIKSSPEKIADYVVFLNNFEHHLLYITGIVEKKFLTDAKSRTSANGWFEFQFPEHYDIMKTFSDLEIKPTRPLAGPILDCYDAEMKQRLFDRLRKRISFEDFLSRLKSK